MIPAVRLDEATLAIHIPWPCPIGERVIRPRLVAAFRRHVKVVVDAEKFLAAPGEAGVGVKDLPCLVLEEDAVAGQVLQAGRPFPWLLEIVKRPAGCNQFRCEGHVEVIVEVGAEG
jgi:hypothetical protein